MQEKQYTPSLLNFFIYNPTFGPREGEVRLINRWRNAKHIFYSWISLLSFCLLFIHFDSLIALLIQGGVFFQEEKKILFYHPSDVEKNEKIRNVGLCEAIVQFTR